MKVTFPINHEGCDYNVTVDEEVATLLLNDPIVAYEYMENILQASTEPSCPSNNEPKPGSSKEPDCLRTDTVPIWTLKKPTAQDQKAVMLMLECRKEMNHLFTDKTTKKSSLWNKIAEKLLQNGLIVGPGGGEKCRQKFANLQRSYLKYVDNQKNTGTPKMDPPPFYEEMHAVIGDKPKVNPVFLQDSLEGHTTETSGDESYEKGLPKKPKISDIENNDKENIEEVLQKSKDGKKGETSEESNAPINRFKSVRKRPSSKQANLIEEMGKDRQNRSEQFNFFKDHLKRSEKQRERLLNILETSLLGNTSKNNKRRRQEKSDSEENSD